MAQKRTKEIIQERLFQGFCLLAVLIPLAILVGLLVYVAKDGVGRLDWSFLNSWPSRKAAKAGIKAALWGSFYLVGLTTAISVPVGIGAAIYLEEYGKKSRMAQLIEVNIANLAGVPSIIYGLLGLGVFVRLAQMDRSLLAGACTLSLLILPIVIIASREALRTVPYRIREASSGLGATKWQTIRRVVLPMAMPGMLTGSILSISRAIGETAPLVVVGALTYITFTPHEYDGGTLYSPYSALPIQIFNWVSRPQEAFIANAAAGIIVLLSIMLLFNIIAVIIRNRLQRKMR